MQQTGQHGVCVICVFLALVLTTSAFCAVPTPEPTDPVGDRIEHMLTPRARIQLGIGRADADRLTRRASSSSLSFPLLSNWRGIIQYLYPEDGMVRRGDVIARVYDPAILEDLERARQLMSVFDVSPLTIAAPLPPLTEPEPDPLLVQPEPPEPTIARSAAESTGRKPAPAAVVNFDFAANAARQEKLRGQAEETAGALSEAMTACEQAKTTVQEAQEDLTARKRLHEQGVLADGSLQAAEERLASAEAEAGRTQVLLNRLQQEYERLAGEIEELERAAAQAREARRAAAARARAPQPEPEPVPEPETVELREPAPVRRGPDLPGAGQVAPREVRDLAAPRYEEVTSPGHAMVAGVVSPEGKLVEVDEELLRLSNIQLAHLTARVGQEFLPEFREGRAVSVTFEDYPNVVFEGWVASAEGLPGSDGADVELLVVCDTGACTDDAYLALQWMVLESGVDDDGSAGQGVDPVMEPAPRSPAARLLQRIFPLLGPSEEYHKRLDEPEVARRDLYEGRLRLQPMPHIAAEDERQQEDEERLAALEQWRCSYLDGMVTTILDDGTAITYPAEGEVSEAVRAMLTGRVSHGRNLCARTMREALGWGLGDAHAWAYRLPHRGYQVRQDGLVRPGDILVWPFTYGPRRTQHIGVAVRQGRKLVLLSNLSGRLGTSEVLGGYLAFYSPDEQADGS